MDLLQQRDFGDKINSAFKFASENFRPLFKALFFIASPVALLTGIASGMYQSNLLKSGGSNFSQYLSAEYFFTMLLGSVTYFLTYATVSAFMTLYEEKGSSADLTPGVVWQKLTENLGDSIGAMALYLIAVVIGMILLVFPGIYLAVALQLFMMFTIRERQPAVEALKSSRRIIKGNWWATLGLVLVMSVISSILSIIFQLPVLVTTIINTLGLGSASGSSPLWLIGASAFSTVGGGLVQSIVSVAIVLQYYHLTETHTASGLFAAIDTLGSGGPVRPQTEED